jgi:Ca2+-binding RTX toxin-like protein
MRLLWKVGLAGKTMVVASRGHGLDQQIGPPDSESLVLQAGHSGKLSVPGGDFLVSAEYERTGDDLIIVGADGARVIVRDYFTQAEPPNLVSDTGTQMSPELIAMLVGPLAPGQYAQAGGGTAPTAQATLIGRVEIVEGSATATRADGTVVSLTKDSSVFKGDVVRTSGDAKLGIVLIDKTTFALGENARMAMNEMVYDPAAAGQGSFFGSLLQGTFVFVTGEIAKAKPENFVVDTPFATIGVRGTKVGVVVESNTVQVSEGAISATHKLTGLSYVVDAGFGMSLPPSGVPQIVPMSLSTLGPAIQSLDSSVSQAMTPFSRNPTGDNNTPGDTPDDSGENPAPDGDQGADPATEPGPGGDGANSQTGGEAGLALPGISTESPFLVEGNLDSPEIVPIEPISPLIISGVVEDGSDGPVSDPPPEDRDQTVQTDPVLPPNLTLTGTSGNDVLIGGDGDDTLIGGLGDDTSFGGTGNDTYVYQSGDGNDVITDIGGFDRILFTETADNNVQDVERTSGGDLILTFGQGQQIQIIGQYIDKPIEQIQIDAIRNTDDSTLTLRLGLNGGATDDLLVGTIGADTISGFGGRDTIRGGLGIDTLDGGAGDDEFWWRQGDGDDVIEGGIGLDRLDIRGDAATANIWTVADVSGRVNVQQTNTGNSLDLGDVEEVKFQGGTGADTIGGVSTSIRIQADGGLGNDSFIGGSGADEFSGGAGADTLDGGSGFDFVIYKNDAFNGGGAGVTVNLGTGTATDGFGNADTLVSIEGVRATNQADNVTGSSFDDSLEGLAGNDTLDGGIGNDTLVGGTGADTLTGGTGVDTFDFGTRDSGALTSVNGTVTGLGLTVNIVTDFTTGTDSIRLLQLEYGLGSTTLSNGVNFEVIGASYDGTNAASSRFASGQGTLILDSDGRLISDLNGSAAGYSVVGEFQSNVPAATDVTIDNVVV